MRRRKWLPRLVRLLLAAPLLIAFVLLAGPYLLFFRHSPTKWPASSGTPRGHLIHVVGWNGPVGGDRRFLQALRDGGCGQSMETWDWTAGRRGLMALWRAQNSDEPATALANHLESLRRESPDRPIDLTADSSGCGVALRAIALLPPEARIRTVVLSSPALSPDYDLAPTLAHVDGQLITFNSDRDLLILCVGTSIFGTVDGKHGSSAGRVGFTNAAPKLVQMNYDPAWSAKYGHGGGHAAALSPGFAKGVIASMLR